MVITYEQLTRALWDSGYDSVRIMECFKCRWPDGCCKVSRESIKIGLDQLPGKTIDCILQRRLTLAQRKEHQSMTETAWVEYKKIEHTAWIRHDPLGGWSDSGEPYRGSWDGYEAELREPKHQLNGIITDVLCKILRLD